MTCEKLKPSFRRMPGSSRAPALALPRRRLEEPLGAAHERIASFKKAQQFVGSACDADAHAPSDAAHGMVDRAKPEFFVRAEIDSVVAAIDLEGLRETPRPAREVQEFSGFAMPLHDFDSLQRLERADQNGSGGFRALADDVEHEMSAVVEKNMDVARGKIHRADSRRGSPKMMSGRIARRISFGLDDATADPSGRQFVHHHFADQEARKLHGLFGEFRAADSPNGDFLL